jgi:hypothetical protein
MFDARGHGDRQAEHGAHDPCTAAADADHLVTLTALGATEMRISPSGACQ